MIKDLKKIKDKLDNHETLSDPEDGVLVDFLTPLLSAPEGMPERKEEEGHINEKFRLSAISHNACYDKWLAYHLKVVGEMREKCSVENLSPIICVHLNIHRTGYNHKPLADRIAQALSTYLSGEEE